MALILSTHGKKNSPVRETPHTQHNCARQHSATLIPDSTRENRDNQVDCPVTTIFSNDEALTSGGERFVYSSTNPDRVTHDLGLGKAIVVPPLGFEPRTLCLSGTTRGISSLL